MNIRFATVNDIAEIVTYSKRATEMSGLEAVVGIGIGDGSLGDHKAHAPTPDSSTLDLVKAQIRARIDSPMSCVLIGDGGTLLGDITVDHMGTPYGKVVSVYAEKAAAGAALLRRFAIWAKAIGATSVAVGPITDQRAILYFRRKGFTEAGTCFAKAINDGDND